MPTFGLAWLGRIRLLAGEADAALPLLRRAAASCFALESPFDLTRANLHLGQALEKAGDTAGSYARRSR